MSQITPPAYGPDTQRSTFQGQPFPPPEPTQQRKSRWVLLAALAVTALAAGGLGFAWGHHVARASDAAAAADAALAAQAVADARLTEAYDVCRSRDAGSTMDLGDDGETIIIDTNSKYGSVAGMQCVLSRLDTPESITAAIGRTTSLMGLQNSQDDGLDYSWSYHPDNGVNMVITLKD